MSARDLRLYEAVAGPTLERFGYERALPDACASAWEHAWYTASEYARRARRKAAVTLGIEAPDRPTSTDPEAPGT